MTYFVADKILNPLLYLTWYLNKYNFVTTWTVESVFNLSFLWECHQRDSTYRPHTLTHAKLAKLNSHVTFKKISGRLVLKLKKLIHLLRELLCKVSSAKCHKIKFEAKCIFSFLKKWDGTYSEKTPYISTESRSV